MSSEVVLIGEFRKAHIWTESTEKMLPRRFRHKFDDNTKQILSKQGNNVWAVLT